jgi:hypothetical protein
MEPIHLRGLAEHGAVTASIGSVPETPERLNRCGVSLCSQSYRIGPLGLPFLRRVKEPCGHDAYR